MPWKKKKAAEEAAAFKKTTRLPSTQCTNDGWLSQVKLGW